MKVRTESEEYKIIKPEDVFYLKLNAYVRYWEDSEVNGEDDYSRKDLEDGKKLKMPFASKDGEYWQPLIDVKRLRIADWPEGMTADIQYKVCDECDFSCLGKDMNKLCRYMPENYVPKFLQYYDDFKDGDYIVMKVGEDGSLQDFPMECLEDWISEILNHSEA